MRSTLGEIGRCQEKERQKQGSREKGCREGETLLTSSQKGRGGREGTGDSTLDFDIMGGKEKG